jgi:long-subunit fatty acid transport protein
MKTLRLFAFLLAAVGFSSLNAQTEQGRWMIGGTAGFNSTDFGGDVKVTDIDFSPNLGYFIIDNLAIGAGLGFGSSKSDKLGDVSSFALTPFARYYFLGTGDVRLFGQGRFGFGSQKVGNLDSQSFTTWGLGAGLNYFLNNNVALEALVGYDSRKVKDAANAANGFGLNIGVQAFFGGGQ